jgi:hypothetical protein
MRTPLTHAELVTLVERIIACDGTEEQVDRMIELFLKNVPDPQASDLILWPDSHPLSRGKGDLSAEDIVRLAFQYQPLITPPPTSETS